MRHTHILVSSVVLVLISVDRKVVSLSIFHSLVVSVNSQVTIVSARSWAVWILHTAVLVVRVGSEHLLGEETTSVNINLLFDLLLLSTKHVTEPASNATAPWLVVELLWILNGRQVLLLLVQVVLVHLFLELDVLFVDSVDLLTEVLMLPLESLDDLVLLLDLLTSLVAQVSLDPDLLSENHELLGLRDDLDESLLLGVASWLAVIGLERSLTHLN